jgi:hypothetical protein
MAVAAAKRRSGAQAAPPPSRTAPPEPKKRPRDRPRPGGRAAPRKVDLDSPPRNPGRKKAGGARAMAAKAMPARKVAPKPKAARGAAAKAAPARRKVAPRRRPAGVIPIAAGHAGRAAVAVTQLPESGLIHRLTRGRAWIGVLGVLLVGIVALNVVTLSFAASSGKIDAKNTELSKENSMLQSRVAQKYGQARVRAEAAALGLKMSTDTVPQLVDVRKGDVAEAASRLAAAAPEATGSASAEEGAGEEGAATEGAAGGEAAYAGEEAAYAGGEAAAGEETVASGESEFTPEELAIYEREYAELLAAEGVTEVPAE